MTHLTTHATYQQQLWARIQSFEMDDPEADFPFSERLARECRWTLDFAQKAIEEYKRFMFMACITTRPITPSLAVDAVWHLHLIYTSSYWEDFCGKTLLKNIHHNPTKGGKEQAFTFIQQYDYTLTFYAQCFGQNPPEPVWETLGNRFGQTHQRWVDLQHYWLIPKISIAGVGRWLKALLQNYQTKRADFAQITDNKRL